MESFRIPSVTSVWNQMGQTRLIQFHLGSALTLTVKVGCTGRASVETPMDQIASVSFTSSRMRKYRSLWNSMGHWLGSTFCRRFQSSTCRLLCKSKPSHLPALAASRCNICLDSYMSEQTIPKWLFVQVLNTAFMVQLCRPSAPSPPSPRKHPPLHRANFGLIPLRSVVRRPARDFRATIPVKQVGPESLM